MKKELQKAYDRSDEEESKNAQMVSELADVQSQLKQALQTVQTQVQQRIYARSKGYAINVNHNIHTPISVCLGN